MFMTFAHRLTARRHVVVSQRVCLLSEIAHHYHFVSELRSINVISRLPSVRSRRAVSAAADPADRAVQPMKVQPMKVQPMKVQPTADPSAAVPPPAPASPPGW
jgi:hypothetical protein